MRIWHQVLTGEIYIEKKYIEVFKKTRIFYDMDNDLINEIFEDLNPVIKTFNKNTTIIRQDEPVVDICAVLSGEVIYTITNSGGERTIFETFNAGEIFGLVTYFVGKKTWTADFVSKTDCVVMFFKGAQLDYIFEKETRAGILLLKNLLFHMSVHCSGLINTIRFLRTKSIREKIITYLRNNMSSVENSYLLLDYNRKQLSEYLFIPQPSLSRELSKMKSEGIIDFYKSHIKIIDLEKFNSL